MTRRHSTWLLWQEDSPQGCDDKKTFHMVVMTRRQSSRLWWQEDIPHGFYDKKTVLTCENVPGQARTGETVSRAGQEDGGRQSTRGAGPHQLVQHDQSSRISVSSLWGPQCSQLRGRTIGASLHSVMRPQLEVWLCRRPAARWRWPPRSPLSAHTGEVQGLQHNFAETQTGSSILQQQLFTDFLFCVQLIQSWLLNIPLI